jgi:hypothetical protein
MRSLTLADGRMLMKLLLAPSMLTCTELAVGQHHRSKTLRKSAIAYDDTARQLSDVVLIKDALVRSRVLCINKKRILNRSSHIEERWKPAGDSPRALKLLSSILVGSDEGRNLNAAGKLLKKLAGISGLELQRHRTEYKVQDSSISKKHCYYCRKTIQIVPTRLFKFTLFNSSRFTAWIHSNATRVGLRFTLYFANKYLSIANRIITKILAGKAHRPHRARPNISVRQARV